MVDSDPAENERRTTERVHTEGKLPSQIVFDVDTDVVQISVGGMTVNVPLPLEVGSQYPFTLGIEGENLEISGVVRNCDPGSTDQPPLTYRVGVEFCKLTERQKKIFVEFVKKNRED